MFTTTLKFCESVLIKENMASIQDSNEFIVFIYDIIDQR